MTVVLLKIHTNMESYGSGKGETSEMGTLVKTMFGRWLLAMGRVIYEIFCGLRAWWKFFIYSFCVKSRTTKPVDNKDHDAMDQSCLEKDFIFKKGICQDLKKQGLLEVLSLGGLRKLGSPSIDIRTVQDPRYDYHSLYTHYMVISLSLLFVVQQWYSFE